MNELHFPWLECAIGVPLLGSLLIRFQRNPEIARLICIAITAVSFVMTLGAWIDFSVQRTSNAVVQPVVGHLSSGMQWPGVNGCGPHLLTIDHLNAPLLPLTSLLLLLVAWTTLRSKLKQFPFSLFLLRSTVLLAAFSCRDPWAVITLLGLAMIPPWLELRQRHQPTRIYSLYMGACVLLMVVGQFLVTSMPNHSTGETVGTILLVLAVLIRTGMFPFHTWLPDLFQRATFGTALMFVAPMPGVYLATRLLLPTAPDWILRTVALISVFTAVYAAGLALVQKESRRFYAYLFLSQSSLVLVGLELVTAVGLTGALSLWLSVGLALGGFGLVLRSVESRAGVLSLKEYHGLFDHMPTLAAFFLLTGLTAVGFPGTFGFIGAEMIVESVVSVYPFISIMVVLASALNGIAIVMVYLAIFTGTQHRTTISLRMQTRERFSVIGVTAIIVLLGIWPQPGIDSRFEAAKDIMQSRRSLETSEPVNATGEHAPH
ncbi:proton-conducting transporter transmembrane domain-containing protein [Planctomicrobium sp. SH527]|uniref:proton-conducting transporter transmembrane domain-containing protein n=1 Tax=Planctomicrobium sp. SH527 TaxID=3448123 RepID=UPI003F5C4D49